AEKITGERPRCRYRTQGNVRAFGHPIGKGTPARLRLPEAGPPAGISSRLAGAVRPETARLVGEWTAGDFSRPPSLKVSVRRGCKGRKGHDFGGPKTPYS